MTQWIDTHVHLFTSATAGETPVAINGGINDVDAYVKGFASNLPSGAVIVDFSKAKTSDHVIETLKPLQQAGVDAKGIIRGNIDDARTFDWIKLPHIAGIRLYGKGSIPDFEADKEKWDRLFALVRSHKKHICLFGDPEYLRQLVEAIPNDIALLFDHLGMPDAALSENQHHYNALLAELSSRFKSGQPIYFKGPGYRTSFDTSLTAPYLVKIIKLFGESQLMLGASDAPFAGPVVETGGKYAGMSNQQVIGYDSILDYLNRLIALTAERTGKSVEILQMQLLYKNAQKLYDFKARDAKAA